MLTRLIIITAISLCMTACNLLSPFLPTTDDGIYNPACNEGKRLNPLPRNWYGMKREDVHAIDGMPARSFESKSYNSGERILVEEYQNPGKSMEPSDTIKDRWGNPERFLRERCDYHYYIYNPETDILVGRSIYTGSHWGRYSPSTEWYRDNRYGAFIDGY